MAYRAKGPDVESLWRPLVSCVAAAEEDHEPGDAREIPTADGTHQCPTLWLGGGRSGLHPRHTTACSLRAGHALPRPHGAGAPPVPYPGPASATRHLRQTLLTALGCEVLLPDIAAPFIKNVWRIRVPASAWKQAARDETTLTIYTVTGAPLILKSAPRHPFLHHCAPMMAASPPPCVSGCRAV